MVSAHHEIGRLNSRHALVNEQENYIIVEMDIMNRQLESEYGCLAFVLKRILLSFIFSTNQ